MEKFNSILKEEQENLVHTEKKLIRKRFLIRLLVFVFIFSIETILSFCSVFVFVRIESWEDLCLGVLSCSVIPVIILSVWIEQKVGVFICNYLSFLFGIGLGFLYDNTDGFSVILYPLFAVVVFVEFICITNSIIVHTHTELKKVKETENEVRGMIEDDERWKRLEDVWK